MALKRITDLAAASALLGNELVEVSQLSTAVKITAGTISAAAADNSYNDSGSGFVTAGFAVGNRVKVEGFTGNVANNIFVGRITALTAGKMTIGGTDGDVIVNDAAGESVTITKWNSRRTTVADIIAAASGGGVYIVPFGFSASPVASEILLIHVFAETVDFTDDWTGAQKYVGTNPTATATLTIKKNGASIGSISISTAGAATFATTGGATQFVAGDVMTVEAQLAPDASLANCAFTFKGIRS